ncbi:hypothetical protein SUDANB121_05487 [Nocardiopsis dassonvillei]|uniref:hypothetical protein n=1 Tax=Nocardiopsis dassonvillei TaxID=2014 RepID=UPI003F57AA20
MPAGSSWSCPTGVPLGPLRVVDLADEPASPDPPGHEREVYRAAVERITGYVDGLGGEHATPTARPVRVSGARTRCDFGVPGLGRRRTRLI